MRERSVRWLDDAGSDTARSQGRSDPPECGPEGSLAKIARELGVSVSTLRDVAQSDAPPGEAAVHDGRTGGTAPGSARGGAASARGARHLKKSHGLLRQAARVTFAFVQAEKAHHAVRQLCRTLGISPSGFYAWQRRRPPERQRTDRRLSVYLRATHQASGGTYGSPRLHHDVRTRGLAHRSQSRHPADAPRGAGRPAAAAVSPHHRTRPGRGAGPQSPRPALHRGPSEYRLGRRHYRAPDTRGVVVSRGPAGSVFASRCGLGDRHPLETRLVLTAWRRALALRRRAPRQHHSDRGTQYTSAAYQRDSRPIASGAV